MATLRSYWKSIIWSLLILYMSLIREYHWMPLPEFTWRDKLFHAIVYCIFGLLLGMDLKRNNTGSPGYWIILLLIPILYGGIIELLQHYFFPPRVGDWYDFLANTTGVLIASLICRITVMK